MNSYFNNVEDPSNSAKNDKLSQLRQILEKNLKSSTPSSPVVVVNSAFRPTEPKLNVVGNSCVVEAGNGGGQAGGGAWGDGGGSSANNGAGPAAATPSSTSLCNRRRVSFNPLVVQDTGGHALTGKREDTNLFNPILVLMLSLFFFNTLGNNGNSHGPSSSNMVLLPSPGGTNTVGGTGNSSGGTTVVRKRHFSFQPIPHGQGSLPQSPNTSPFISPRSTPVPMLRSRHSSGSALPLPLHLLPSGPGGGLHKPTQVGPFGSNGSDISRAATFGSTSECSTPFISPHGTPIPFNRSRHNSAQGRLCRSRHSSGLGKLTLQRLV